MRIRALSTLGAIGVFLILGPVAMEAAEKHTSKGHATYVQTGESFKLPDGRSAMRQTSRGFVMTDDPNDPLNMTSQNCVGTALMTSAGAPATAYGYCDAVDRDGNVWWIWWSTAGETGKWGFLGGTGKFDGVKGGGTTRTAAVWPAEGKLVITWDGAWETK